MTRFEAESLAEYLNRTYSGPAGVFCNFAAFSAHRSSVTTDANCFWEYYITSPEGVYLNGRPLTFSEQRAAISHAKAVLHIHD